MLDEPFEGVDPVSTRTMRLILDRLRAGGGTIILSTPVMEPSPRSSRLQRQNSGRAESSPCSRDCGGASFAAPSAKGERNGLP